MIKINCETKDKLKLTEMKYFQGNLKKRTDKDIEELSNSLLNEGLMMPFAVWKHDNENLLLDGHGRKEALVRLSMDQPDLLIKEWPVVYVEAETEDDARKALLQITSQYGKITKAGVKQFCVSIPDYKAPAISKFQATPVQKSKVKVSKGPEKLIIKIRCDADKVEAFKSILSELSYIDIL